MKRYYYRTSDGESHGPSVLDFPVREVRYGALAPELRVREGGASGKHCECIGQFKGFKAF